MDQTSQKNQGMNRRTFLNFSVFVVAGFLAGCVSWKRIGSELKPIAEGFEPYNGINPHARRWQRQTFLDNIYEHKVDWAGAQYHNLPPNTPIIAPADGTLALKYTKTGYHGLEDSIVIDHGLLFSTKLYHMKYRSCKIPKRSEVKRGDVVGLTGHIPFKTGMKFFGILGDMDDYGENFNYMKPFGGFQTEEDYGVIRRSNLHMKLISELRQKYIGPGKEQLNDVGSTGIPKSLSHDTSGEYPWSYAMLFKLLNQMYQNHPELFRGTTSENDSLIKEIYVNQPVVLTLPFKV